MNNIQSKLSRGFLLAVMFLGTAKAGEFNFQTHPDGVTLDPSSPYIGASFIPQANKWYLIGSNDNFGGGDFDFNDGIFLAGVHADGWMVVYPLGYVSGDTTQSWKFGDTLIEYGETGMRFVLNVSLGEEFIIQNLVGDIVYQSGPGSRNLDGSPHFWIKDLSTTQPTSTPEPATWGCALIAGGLAWRKIRTY